MTAKVPHARLTGGPRSVHRKAPELRPDQARCPVCLNGARLTNSGHLHRHLDLYGHTCYNRAAGLL